MSEEKTKILIVDDQLVFAQALVALMQTVAGIEVLGSCTSGEKAIEFVKVNPPHIVILDYRMPEGLSGLETIKQLQVVAPEVKTLVLTFLDETNYLIQALSSGADGFLLKNADIEDIVYALRKLRRGQKFIDNELAYKLFLIASSKPGNGREVKNMEGETEFLTNREVEIVQCIVKGLSSKDIARLLYISPATVETHRKNILKKSGCKNSAELTYWAIREGLG